MTMGRQPTILLMRTLIISLCLALGLWGCEINPAAKSGSASPQPSAEEKLISQIRQDIEAFRLTSPEKENAIYRISELAKLAPEHPMVLKLRGQVAERYAMLVEQTLVADKLDKAEHYLEKAKSIDPDLPKLQTLTTNLNSKRAEIAAAAQKAAAEAKRQAEEAAAKAAAEATETAAAAIAKVAEPATPKEEPKPVSVKPAEKQTLSEPKTVALNQKSINARSTLVGLALDNVSGDIVESNASVVIRAQSMRDYRWLSALLKTSVYLKDSDFKLRAEPFIDDSIEPSLEINPDKVR